MYPGAAFGVCPGMSRDDDDDFERPLWQRVGVGLVAVMLIAGAWFVLRGPGSASQGGGGGLRTPVAAAAAGPPGGSVTSTTAPTASTTTTMADSVAASGAPASTTSTTAGAVASSAESAPAASGSTVDAVSSSTTVEAAATSTSVDAASTSTSSPPSSASTPDAAAGAAPAAAAVTYATLPDGSPTPVLALFDVNSVTLSGSVPSRQAADRLVAMTAANSTTTAAVVDLLTIDPSVPPGVGVRVVELTSPRFAANSDDLVGDHAQEFDRVAAILHAFPHVTALVIGHADQRGSERANFAVSEGRARAVVAHLVSTGIAADRLSSRAVGEADLLSLGDDETALALNRRTEVVFYGLLLPG